MIGRISFPDRSRALSLFCGFGLLALLLLAAGLTACQPGEHRGRRSDETVDTAAVKSALDSMRQVFISAYEAGDAEKNASLWTEDIRQPPRFLLRFEDVTRSRP